MKMSVNKKIKVLKELKPNDEWKKANRIFVLEEIGRRSSIGANREVYASQISGALFPWKVFKLVARPVMAMTAIFGLVLSGGFSVSASENAMPGDRLYPLKLATEKVQIALTLDKTEAAKKHIELAGKRINEVKIIKENSDSPGKKMEKINVAMEKFEKEIATVQNKFDNLKEAATSQATIEVAKIVDSKVDEYRETLAKAATVFLPTREEVEKINKGLDLAEETGNKALAVIVEKHTSGEIVQPEGDVLRRVEQKIEKAEERIIKIENKINNLAAEEGGKIQGAATQAKEILSQAKEALSQKNLFVALEKTIEGKKLTKQAEQAAAGAEALGNISVSENNSDSDVVSVDNLTNAPVDEINTINNTGTTNNNTTSSTTTVKVYPKKIKVSEPAPSPEPEIDESTIKVGIDLKQEPTE